MTLMWPWVRIVIASQIMKIQFKIPYFLIPIDILWYHISVPQITYRDSLKIRLRYFMESIVKQQKTQFVDIVLEFRAPWIR